MHKLLVIFLSRFNHFNFFKIKKTNGNAKLEFRPDISCIIFEQIPYIDTRKNFLNTKRTTRGSGFQMSDIKRRF